MKFEAPAGTGVSPSSYDEPPIGGGGALPKKARFSMETGFREAQTMLGQAPRPTAIFCFSDELAVGALRAVREGGRPGDATERSRG